MLYAEGDRCTLTDSAELSFPAGVAAAFAGGSTAAVLTVSGTSCHQQLRWLHLMLALLRGVRPAAIVKKTEEDKVSIQQTEASQYSD